MKSKSDLVMVALIVFFCGIIFYLFYKNLNKKEVPLRIADNSFTDSLSFLKFQKSYLDQLIYMANWENNRTHFLDTLRLYEQKDEHKEFPKKLNTLLAKRKPNIIIRYTEIGCNSCADSTFKFIEKYHLESKYNILVLVDFSNYDAYLKWMKVSEIKHPVYWLKKGSLPFLIESESNSYVFTLNASLVANDFFVPNSRFSDYIDNYFYSMNAKL